MYADALVRRVDPMHRNMSEYFRQEIAQPFGIDFHIGLPPELYHRLARFREFSLLEKRFNVLETIAALFWPYTRKASYAIDFEWEGHHIVGHSGYGGSQGGADTTLGLGFAYLTNHCSLYLSEDPRANSLFDAFYEGYNDYIKKIS